MLKNISKKTRILSGSVLGLLVIGGLIFTTSSSDNYAIFDAYRSDYSLQHGSPSEYGFDENGNFIVQDQMQGRWERLSEEQAPTVMAMIENQSEIQEDHAEATEKMTGATSRAIASQDTRDVASEGKTASSGEGALLPGAAVGTGLVNGREPQAVASDSSALHEKHLSECLQADLQNQSSELKGALHEFQLPRKFSKNEALCVFVDGKSVDYSRIDSDRVRIDWKIAKTSTKVSASYCAEGSKCKITCPAPEKDFWDTIGDADSVPAGEGFAVDETVEDKELQKELKALKDVLNRKPAKARVSVWKVSEVHEVACK